MYLNEIYTPDDVRAVVQVYGERDHKELDKLMRLGTPGTRLWVLPTMDGHGNKPRGLGRPAVSLGLSMSKIEAVFGNGPSYMGTWAVQYRFEDGTEGQSRWYVVALDDARRAWWITDGDGILVAGGPPIFDADRAAEITDRFGGIAQLGLGDEDPDRS